MLEILSHYYYLPMRFVVTGMVILLFVEIKHLLAPTDQKQILGVLYLIDAQMRLPIAHYETTIGRSNACDVVIKLLSVSRQHAVLTKTECGDWVIYDTKSKGGILIGNQNGSQRGHTIALGEEFSMAGVRMMILPASRSDIQTAQKLARQNQIAWYAAIKNTMAGLRARLPFGIGVKRQKRGSIQKAFLLLNLFQLFAYVGFALTVSAPYQWMLLLSFLLLMGLPWGYRMIGLKLGITNMGAETVGFFLSTLSICATTSASPSELAKQIGAILLGVLTFCIMCVVLKRLSLVMRLRGAVATLSMLIFAANMFLGSTINGQRNWIRIGSSLSIQPSEFVKILFVFSCAATLEWLLTTRNLTRLTLYAMACMGFLFLMGDFGTVLIFFLAFLTLIFLTTGDIRAIVLSCVSAVMGAVVVIRYKPYITNRFAGWRNVWKDPWGIGFQQTQSLIAIASGGMLGLGGGRGSLNRVYAADTDLVFGVLVEEWGMIIGALAVACLVLLLIAAIRSHRTSRSSYYVIAACTAGTMFLFQTALNVFGTTDILPLTGITIPFISNGGSSMIASWGLLSFIVATLNYARPTPS